MSPGSAGQSQGPLPGSEARPFPVRLPADAAPAINAAQPAILAALGTASNRVAGWWHPLDEPLSYKQILDPERVISGSFSVGSVRNGQLHNAAELALDGAHHGIIERHRSRHTRFGSRETIDLILHGAAAVATRYPGSKLQVGNISRRQGGQTPWSNSHHAGRDADIAFYVLRADGTSIPAPDLIHFDDHGHALDGSDLRFDVPRNWELARAIVTHPEIVVQWLFISEGLKNLLLDYAREMEEDEEVIRRAGRILHQPTDALPHNDHFHLRVACSPRDRVEGCLDGWPRWEWADWSRRQLLSRSMELARALDDPDPELGLAALDFMVRIQSPFAPEIALTKGVHSRSPAVRLRSLQVASSVSDWSATAIIAAQAFITSASPTGTELGLAYSILRRSMDPLVRDFVLQRLSSPGVSNLEKTFAARSLAHVMDPSLVPILIDHLGIQAATVRREIAHVLHRITNHAQPIEWDTASADERNKGVQQWRQWWETNQHHDREYWLVHSFAQHGIDREVVLTVAGVDAIISLLRQAPDHIVYNANRLLRSTTNRWSSLEETNGEQLYRNWTRWWHRNRDRMLKTYAPVEK